MNFDNRLFDRGTIRIWRAANLAGWPLLGLASALFFRFAGEATAALVRGGPAPASLSLTSPYEALAGTLSSLVGGAALGTLIGSRTYRWQVALSGMAATLAALIWWMGFAGAAGTRGLLGLGTALLMIPAALLTARHAKGNRPGV